MDKKISVDVTSLIPFPNIELSHDDLTKNIIINQYVDKLTDIYDLNVISRELALEKLESIREVDDPEIRGIALAGIGGIHTYVGNYVKAFAAFRHSLSLVSSNEAIAILYSELSSLMRKLGYVTEAIALLNNAIDNTHNKHLYWKLFTQRAICNRLLNPVSALEEFHESIKFYSDEKNLLRIGRVYRAIGNAYVKLNDFDLAKQYYVSALQLAREQNAQILINEVSNDIGWLLISSKQYQEAEVVFNKLIEDDLSPYEKSLALQNLAYLQYEQTNYKPAIELHSKSLQLTTQYEMRDMAFEDYYKLGVCHEHIGELGLADKYFATGYTDLQQEINYGLRILGYRKKLLNTYIDFLNRYKSIPDIDVDQEIFGRFMNNSLEEIRNVFHSEIFLKHMEITKNAPELCQKLGIETRTYFLYQKKLGLKRGPGGHAAGLNDPYFARYLDSMIDLDWRLVNRKFETDLFGFMLKKHHSNKRALANTLQVSYQQVLQKTKGM